MRLAEVFLYIIVGRRERPLKLTARLTVCCWGAGAGILPLSRGVSVAYAPLRLHIGLQPTKHISHPLLAHRISPIKRLRFLSLSPAFSRSPQNPSLISIVCIGTWTTMHIIFFFIFKPIAWKKKSWVRYIYAERLKINCWMKQFCINIY